MGKMRTVFGSTIVAAVVVAGLLMPAGVWSQAPSEHLQHVDKQLAEKQAAAEAHRKQMEGIKDRRLLDVEMQKHFKMTEDILALMVERRKLTQGQAAMPSAPQSSGQPSAQGGGMSGGMGGMRGGMEKGMEGMQRGGGMMEKEMGGMKGGGMPGMAGAGAAAPAPGATTNDMDQMMQRIATHSTYMETVKDPAALQQEMLRHQKMLDQMMQLMQR